MASAAVYVPACVLRLRVLSWNLAPGNPRWQELAAVLAGWDWDVAALRGVPARWPLPLATALDAEFRYSSTATGLRLGRLLTLAPLRPGGGESADAILARDDRLVAEWPVEGRRAQRRGLHAARLAAGLWVAGIQDGVDAFDELLTVVGSDALVVCGPSAAAVPAALAEVARGGEDAIWASAALVAVEPAEALAGGAVRGNPPLAVTLERRA